MAALRIAANNAVSPMLQAKTLNGFELVGDTGPPVVDCVNEESHEAQGRHFHATGVSVYSGGSATPVTLRHRYLSEGGYVLQKDFPEPQLLG
jgi:hypothetical protein